MQDEDFFDKALLAAATGKLSDPSRVSDCTIPKSCVSFAEKLMEAREKAISQPENGRV